GRRGMLPLGNLIFGYMLYLPTGRLKRQRIRGLPFEHALNGFILLQGYRYRAKTGSNPVVGDNHRFSQLLAAQLPARVGQVRPYTSAVSPRSMAAGPVGGVSRVA